MTEGYCVKCKAKKPIADGVEETMKNGRKAIKGRCPTCGTVMFKILGKAAAAPAPAAPAPAPSTILPSGPRSMFSYAQRTSTTVQPIKKSTAGSRKRAAAEMQRTNVSIDQFVVRRERVKKTKDSSPNKELVR